MTPVRVQNHLQAAWAAGRMAADQIEQAERAMNEPKALEDFLQDEAGSRFDTAVKLAQLQSAAEGAYEEFQYDPEFDPDVLAACKLIRDFEFKV